MKIKAAGRSFEVRSGKCEVTTHFPNDPRGMKGLRCNHTVTVKHGNRSERFRFTNSISDYETGKRTMDKDDLKNALTSFIGDAISGTLSYDDFVGEFGYDHYDVYAKRVYKGCQQSYEKAIRLGLSEDELYEVVNALNKEGD